MLSQSPRTALRGFSSTYHQVPHPLFLSATRTYSAPMSAWNGWYHVTGSTYGAWLPGDPRGWRHRKHRRHVEGDYKHPPPPGEGEALLHDAEDRLKRPPVHLTVEQRRIAGQAVVEMVVDQGIELLALSLDAVHLHLLARFPDGVVRPAVGRAKKHAYHELRETGHAGKVWAKRCGVKPIAGRAHQVRAYHYILEHEQVGAWTWSFREGLSWREGARRQAAAACLTAPGGGDTFSRMKATIAELKEAFEAAYGRAPAGVVRAPGRVNLIGEHTDYNDGFVLPIAIERHTLGGWAPREDGRVRFRSAQADGEAVIDLDGEIAPGEPKWANYATGVAAGLTARGVALVGCDVLFVSDVPIGGGLSSSASLEVAAAKALLAAAGTLDAIADRELALVCQKAEHDFAGAPCGIMDQSIAILGRAGRALLLDCRSGETRQIPFDDPSVVLLVADTQVKHEISDGGYAARRSQCESAAATLGLKALRDTDAARIEAAGADGTLAGKELMRARHVVGEIARTLEAVEALQAGDYARFGERMYGSHAALRDDYEVSCEELDAIVELARAADGVYGARMTGGGFGGCAIVLAAADRAGQIEQAVTSGFAERFGRPCPIFATRAAAGAGVIE